MDVISLKRSGKEWRLLLSGDLKGIAKALSRSAKDD